MNTEQARKLIDTIEKLRGLHQRQAELMDELADLAYLAAAHGIDPKEQGLKIRKSSDTMNRVPQPLRRALAACSFRLHPCAEVHVWHVVSPTVDKIICAPPWRQVNRTLMNQRELP